MICNSSNGSTLPPDRIPTIGPANAPGYCSSAATAAAPAGSTTSLRRSRHSSTARERDRLGQGLLQHIAVQVHVGAVAASRVELRQRYSPWHEDRRLRAEQRSGERHTLRVVSRTGSDDTASTLLFGQPVDPVVRTAY